MSAVASRTPDRNVAGLPGFEPCCGLVAAARDSIAAHYAARGLGLLALAGKRHEARRFVTVLTTQP
jgi:hypothetical protein